MKKLIVSTLAILFLQCLSPTVMAGGTPNPNISVQPITGFGPEGDGGGWDEPDLIAPQNFGSGDSLQVITKGENVKIDFISRLITFFVFPNISIHQPSEELNRHGKNIRRMPAKRR